MEFIIPQTINLRADNPPMQYDAGLEYGDALAHTWRVRVLDGNVPADLSGCTCRLYFTRPQPKSQEGDPDIATVLIDGQAGDGYAEATFVSSCYSQAGPVVAVLRITKDERVMAVARLHTWVRRDTSDSIVDPGRIIPSLEELLARIDEMELATRRALSAAEKANASASGAGKAAGRADDATQAAKDATQDARELTDRWDDVDVKCEVLPPSENPWAAVDQTAHSTTFRFGLPRSNLAYSTFEVNDGMELVMTSPDGFSDIGFELTQDGDLEVVVH